MKFDSEKFKNLGKLDRLEVYLLAADNPVGKKQLRPIFRRKRSKEVLTREQVTAIKKGRRVLRREMKAQGLKRRIDFEVTATNLGLYFDRNRLLWPFFLWLIRDNTVAKVLVTTAVLTTVVTVTEPVIEYITQYVTQYVTQFVTQYVDRYLPEYIDREVDRFTINLSDGLTDRGFLLAEKVEDFEPDEDGKINATTNLICPPVAGIPCISITSIPESVERIDGAHHDTYFAYTFYAKYIVDSDDPSAQEATEYDWQLKLNYEKSNDGEADISTAVWAMVFEDGQMTFHAELGADGETETLPDRAVTNMAYADAPLMAYAKYPSQQYELVKAGQYYNYYRLVPIDFVSDTVIAQGNQPEVMPNDIHKYTVVLWLEGDDPECTDALMGSAIGMSFHIKLPEENVDVDTGESTEPTT